MTVRIAVVGAGLIGRRHAAAVVAAPETALASVVDPAEAGAELAAACGVSHYRSLAQMIAADRPDGVVLATPNQLHVDGALQCIAAGLPAIVEKPLAADVMGAETIVAAGLASGIALLTGHHRRYNALVSRAKQVIDRGDLGPIIAVQATTWFHKPDTYFDIEWRRRAGGGPVNINLVHDIDLMRHLCGDIVEVHAMESNAIRANEVEETAVVLVRFAGGALGTMTVSDIVVGPWSWELTARENPAFPPTPESCYRIGGTRGSLSLPNLALWSYPGERSWTEPITTTRFTFDFEDPLVRQIRHFAAVIRGEDIPLVSAEEGLRNLKVIEAVKASAATGQTVRLT